MVYKTHKIKMLFKNKENERNKIHFLIVKVWDEESRLIGIEQNDSDG